jgi:hypothetical protein
VGEGCPQAAFLERFRPIFIFIAMTILDTIPDFLKQHNKFELLLIRRKGQIIRDRLSMLREYIIKVASSFPSQCHIRFASITRDWKPFHEPLLLQLIYHIGDTPAWNRKGVAYFLDGMRTFIV